MNLLPSKLRETTFYGDIFSVNGYGCLVFGSGKSAAFREVGKFVAYDFAGLTRIEDKLYGHFEPPLAHKDFQPNERIKIDYMFNCLFEAESADMFKDKLLELTSVSYEEFVEYSYFNLNFSNSTKNFIAVSKGCSIQEYIIVPWMPEFEDKVKLYKKHFNI